MKILIASSYALMIAIKFCGMISALSPLHKLVAIVVEGAATGAPACHESKSFTG